MDRGPIGIQTVKRINASVNPLAALLKAADRVKRQNTTEQDTERIRGPRSRYCAVIVLHRMLQSNERFCAMR
jgi:hypothetical protein